MRGVLYARLPPRRLDRFHLPPFWGTPPARRRANCLLAPLLLCVRAMAILPVSFSPPLKAAATLQAGAWTTRPAYWIDGAEETDGGFGDFSRLRVGRNGTRVVVLDVEIVDAAPVSKVLVYSPEGALLVNLAPEELSSGLSGIVGIRADADGFQVRYMEGSRKYSYDDANVIGTTTYPPGHRRGTPLDDGGFLTRSDLPTWNWGRRNPAPRQQAVLRLEPAADHWKSDTMVVLDIRHQVWFVGIRGRGNRFGSRVSVSQPFSDHDLTWFDSRAGSVGVVRRNAAAGVVEVFEVVAPGDTAWHRRFLVPAVPLASETAEAAIEKNLSLAASAGEREGLTQAEVRRIVEDAMFVPSHLPTVVAVVATGSGEVWLKTAEVSQGKSVWYSVTRGDGDASVRRVLLSTTFEVQDAFGEHVWGISEEPSGPRRVVGLRLMPPL